MSNMCESLSHNVLAASRAVSRGAHPSPASVGHQQVGREIGHLVLPPVRVASLVLADRRVHKIHVRAWVERTVRRGEELGEWNLIPKEINEGGAPREGRRVAVLRGLERARWGRHPVVVVIDRVVHPCAHARFLVPHEVVGVLHLPQLWLLPKVGRRHRARGPATSSRTSRRSQRAKLRGLGQLMCRPRPPGQAGPRARRPGPGARVS
mmetsp:Transcript_8267/g.21154  ORF Transcript_8267/g.21154 Transcript_8267/m.21154 type:complete len:208 (+) Transcript_8267:72-695(+)